jgi:pimeloyl-ACP methyl ester carboxylesterase
MNNYSLEPFRAALVVLKGLFDPVICHLVNLNAILSSLQIENDRSRLCVASFHVLSNPENDQHLKILNQEPIKNLIETTNAMLEHEPNIFNNIVVKHFGISEKQVDLEGLQITLQKNKKGILRNVSESLIKNGFMISTEIPSALTAGILSLFANSDWNPKEPITNPDKPPVLFVHGLKHNQSGWIFGDKMLKKSKFKDKFGSFYFISYDKVISNSWDKTIDDFVKIVSNKIESILRITGHKQIILIGHSLGGLVCSRYAETLGSSNCKNVITIGSPFDGSHVASFLENQKNLFGLSHREIDKQLSVGSKILKEIAETARESDWKGKIRYYCIRSNKDLLVPMENTLVTKDPRRIFTLESSGHIALLFTPKVWWKVADWLNEIYSNF